jgi:hypothetical protein
VAAGEGSSSSGREGGKEAEGAVGEIARAAGEVAGATVEVECAAGGSMRL